jgi:hypothetical protein
LYGSTFLKDVSEVGRSVLLKHLLDHLDSGCILLNLSVAHFDVGRAFEIPELFQWIDWFGLLIFAFRTAAWKFFGRVREVVRGLVA